MAALTGTVALWLIAEQLSVFNWLSDLGRTSLTVYVFHFVPFALFHDADEVHQWSSYSSTAVVVAYTIIWALVGTWLHRQFSFTLEAFMRRFEPVVRIRAESEFAPLVRGPVGVQHPLGDEAAEATSLRLENCSSIAVRRP